MLQLLGSTELKTCDKEAIYKQGMPLWFQSKVSMYVYNNISVYSSTDIGTTAILLDSTRTQH